MLASGGSYSMQKLRNIISDDFPLNEVSNSLLIKTLAIALTESLDETTKLREDIDAFQTRFLMNEIENQEIFKTISADHNNLVKKVYQIDREQLDTQQYIRRWTIEIKGIPESIEQKDLKSYVINQILERACGYKLYPRDVEACHRLWNRNPREPARVVARLVNREDAENAIRGRYKLHNYAHLKRIFIVDNLCPRYREIFDELTELKQSGIINQVWSYNGKIHFKSTNNRRAKGKRVFHMDDLEPLKASARLFELERNARNEYEEMTSNIPLHMPSNNYQATVTPSPEAQHLHTSSTHHEPATRVTDVTPTQDQVAPASLQIAPDSVQVDPAHRQAPPTLPAVPPVTQVTDVSDLSAVTVADDDSLADIPDLEKSVDIPNSYLKPVTMSPGSVVSTETQDVKFAEESSSTGSAQPFSESPSSLPLESIPDHSPSLDDVTASPTTEAIKNDVSNVIERPSLTEVVTCHPPEDQGGDSTSNSIKPADKIEIDSVDCVPTVHLNHVTPFDEIIPELSPSHDDVDATIDVNINAPDLVIDCPSSAVVVCDNSLDNQSVGVISISPKSASNVRNDRVDSAIVHPPNPVTPLTDAPSHDADTPSTEVVTCHSPENKGVTSSNSPQPTGNVLTVHHHINNRETPLDENIPDLAPFHVTAAAPLTNVTMNDDVPDTEIECPSLPAVKCDQSLDDQGAVGISISPLASNVVDDPMDSATVHPLKLMTPLADTPSHDTPPSIVSAINDVPSTDIRYPSPPEVENDRSQDDEVSNSPTQMNNMDDPPLDAPPTDVMIDPGNPIVSPETVSISVSNNEKSTVWSEDDVFHEPGEPAPTQTSPIPEEDHDRYYSCSASIGGLQLKLKRQTVSILNEFCQSLDSSSPKDLGSQSHSFTHDPLDQLASLSESQLSHAGFFNNNDSVPEVSVKLSQCNTYASLLTERNSSG